ncbi:hypothetical protein DN730_17355 [Marinomonas piezotolerans]|uniref:Uncharacterized protein n=1 Tax=Marinomonas piezotolerans TaxID=2213058 RepID=A0A370U4W6_9GAMM|nr:hypothetical protein [Marinomonas piezotolerans]RDL42829.1 hypothetical protein DN730_17355 [Marinomonas piezotolerans]
MKQIVHRIAAVTATLCVATFFVTTLLVELFGSIEAIRQVKSLIVFPGLFILVPAIALTGATGFSLSKQRSGKIVNRKKKRMPFIALGGVFVLIPAAIFLNQWAAEGNFNTQFYLLQATELIAGAVNLTLMTMNIIDGRKLVFKER